MSLLELLKLFIKETDKNLERISFFIIIPISILLFSSNSFLKTIGVYPLKEKYNFYLGIIFILTISIITIAEFTKIINYKYTWQQKIITKQYLKKLTIPEKEILKYYIENQNKTQYLSKSDGIVNGLLKENLFYLATTTGTYFETENYKKGGSYELEMKHPYNIHSWIYLYLNKNKHLLE